MTLRIDLDPLRQELSRIQDQQRVIERGIGLASLMASEAIITSQIRAEEKRRQNRKLLKNNVVWRDTISTLTDNVPEVDEDGPQGWLTTRLDRIDIIGDMIATARLIGSNNSESSEKWNELVSSGDACYAICYDTLRCHGKEDDRFSMTEKNRVRQARPGISRMTYSEIYRGVAPKHQWGPWEIEDWDSARTEPMMGFKPPTGMEIRWATDFMSFQII